MRTLERLSEAAEKAVKEIAEKKRKREFKYLRRDPSKDNATAIRPPFVRDVEKILNSAYYNRLSDKTQVLSFYRNDDITRRALHVQLVSRIARTVGAALGLDADLIEAIALGHDMGHTPFGHAGETILDELLFSESGVHFNHNVQSVRVLDTVFGYNLTLETLDGILCHNGEMPSDSYRPLGIKDFADFDERMSACMKDGAYIKTLVPATLEGCLVRVCDMIAYLGKDRQDYERAGLGEETFESDELMASNSQIINNLCVNIVENSVGKDAILMDEKHFKSLKAAKDENYRAIYKIEAVVRHYDDTIRPMMSRMFERLVSDLKQKNESSFVYRHHIKFIDDRLSYRGGAKRYLEQPVGLIAADYISSMTDSYFLSLYKQLFGIRVHGYFD